MWITIYKHKNKPFKKSFFSILFIPKRSSACLGVDKVKRKSTSRPRISEQLAIFCAKGFFQPC